MDDSDTNKEWKKQKEYRQRENEKRETDKTDAKSNKFFWIIWW